MVEIYSVLFFQQDAESTQLFCWYSNSFNRERLAGSDNIQRMYLVQEETNAAEPRNQVMESGVNSKA